MNTHTSISQGLALGLIFVALIVGLGAGYLLTPEYAAKRATMQSGMSMELGPADRQTDLRYLTGMIAHHKAAIHLLQQVQTHSTRPELQELAKNVIAADLVDIEKLEAQRTEWYGPQRPVSQYQRINLGAAGENFDLRFLNAMITHHQEAIMIAQDVRTKSTRDEVLQRADTTIVALSAGLETLRGWRKEWYGIE